MKAIFSAVKPEITSPDRDHAVTPLKSYVRKEGKDTRAGGEGRGGEGPVRPGPIGISNISCKSNVCRQGRGRGGRQWTSRSARARGREGRGEGPRRGQSRHSIMPCKRHRVSGARGAQRANGSGSAAQRDATPIRANSVLFLCFCLTGRPGPMAVALWVGTGIGALRCILLAPPCL